MYKTKGLFVLSRSCSAMAVAMIIAQMALSPAQAGGIFVSAPSRVDIAYDDSRGLLYITSGDEMLRYQLSTQSFQAPVTIPDAFLYGMDISPDGKMAAIADAIYSNNDSYVYFVNLHTLAVNSAQFPLDGAAGTYDVAYGKDGNLLVSSEYNGSGNVNLWLYDPKTGAETSIGSPRQNTMLKTTANGKVVALAEGNSSSGPFGSYILKSGTFNDSGRADNFLFEIGVNKDATLYALPTSGGTYIADNTYALTNTVIGNSSSQPIAATFDPKSDLVYCPFSGTTDVEAYDAKTGTLVKSYNFEDNFQWNNQAFVQGRTKLSKDGKLLFVTVTGGVRYGNPRK